MSEPVHYASTRNSGALATFSEALTQGLAPDGGLYVPTAWPRFDPRQLPANSSLAVLAGKLIAPFVGTEPLAAELGAIVAEAFNFPAPLVTLGTEGRLAVLELFHGPTAAFKDFGARFLAASLTRLRASAAGKAAGKRLQILVATSGDTGGAVAAAFHRQPGMNVSVLFPKGLVTPTQERQLTCWGENVQSFAVRGTFDDCQRLVKQAFGDASLQKRFDVSSANSINLGRLVPQTVYYAAASLAVWRTYGESASFVIPSGNLGNSLACIWARRLGLPIADVVLAHNANRTVPDYLENGEWRPRASIPTLASAMDVGDPSNFERLKSLLPDIGEMRAAITACAIDDDAIRRQIHRGFERFGQIWCPHTATAAEAYERLPEEKRRRGRWILVATAHAAKFREIVEPLIGREVTVPRSLAELFARPTAVTEIDARLDALVASIG